MRILFFLVAIISFNVHAERSIVEKSGDVLQFAVPLSAYAYSDNVDDSKGKRQLVKGMITTQIASEFLKRTTKKPRPCYPNSLTSFPSGHTAAGMFPAFYMKKRYGTRKAIPYFILATYIGYTRVYACKHDWVDVMGSVALSYGIAETMVSEYEDDVIPLIEFKWEF